MQGFALVGDRRMDEDRDGHQGGGPAHPASVTPMTAPGRDVRTGVDAASAQGANVACTTGPTALLLSLDVASVVSCRGRPQHVLDRYAESVRQGLMRIPYAIRRSRRHGIDLELLKNRIVGQDLDESFEGWWRQVHPALVIAETPEILAVADRLRRLPKVDKILRRGQGPLQEVILMTVATAVVERRAILTMAKDSYARYQEVAPFDVELLPVIGPGDCARR